MIKKYKVKNPDFVIDVNAMYEDEDGTIYEIIIDGNIYSNWLNEEETEDIVQALLFKRNYEEVKI